MICEKCKEEHTGGYGSGRFCSSKCSRSFSTASKRAEINAKVSQTLSGKEYPERRGKPIPAATKIRMDQNRETKNSLVAFDDCTMGMKRKRILAEQNGACNHCALTEWRGKPLTLELEHKDGNNQNNSRENLEYICPNCHSQTDTWRGRNVALRKKVSDEDMIEVLRQTRSMHKTLLHFGMAAKGNNYIRVKRLIEEHGIAIVLHNKRTASQILSDDQVREIRVRRANGESIELLAKTFGISRKTLSDAANKQTYKHVE